MNPMGILQIKAAFDTFKKNHPKFINFLNLVSKEGIRENTVIEVTVTTPEGNKYNANLKVTESDLALMEQIKQIQN